MLHMSTCQVTKISCIFLATVQLRYERPTHTQNVGNENELNDWEDLLVLYSLCCYESSWGKPPAPASP